MPNEPFFKFAPPQRRREEPKSFSKLLIFFIILLIFLVSAVAVTLVNATQPLTVYLDGQFAGTLAGPGLVYSIEGSTINITTAEGVLGCTLDTVFDDRFEEPH